MFSNYYCKVWRQDPPVFERVGVFASSSLFPSSSSSVFVGSDIDSFSSASLVVSSSESLTLPSSSVVPSRSLVPSSSSSSLFGYGPEDVPQQVSSLPNRTNQVGQTVNQNLAPYFDDPLGGVLSFAADNLPVGLVCSLLGVVTGVVTMAGVRLVTIHVQNDAGEIVSTFTWTVNSLI